MVARHSRGNGPTRLHHRLKSDTGVDSDSWEGRYADMRRSKLRELAMGPRDSPSEEEIRRCKFHAERRLMEIGWSIQDMIFLPGSREQRRWARLLQLSESRLVATTVPKVMQIEQEFWEYLHPKFFRLLTMNRKTRLWKEGRTRALNCRLRLSHLLSEIKSEIPPVVSFRIHKDRDLESASSIAISQTTAFPEAADALHWKPIQDIFKPSLDPDKLTQLFNSRRKEIDQSITNWTEWLHSHLVSTIPEIKGRKIRPTLVVGKTNPFSNLSKDMKLLLRADSLFCNQDADDAPIKVYTYDDILQFLKTDSDLRINNDKPRRFWDTITCQFSTYPLARKIAKELLGSIGCLNASYLELEGNWVCERCIDSERRSWTQMVEHYVLEKLTYLAVQARSDENDVPYRDIHDPTITDQPMVKYVSQKVVQKSDAPPDEKVRQCKICVLWPIKRDVRGRGREIFRHLLDVHEIEKPLYMEHFGSPYELSGLSIQTRIGRIDMSNEEPRIPETKKNGPSDSESGDDDADSDDMEFDSECDSDTGSILALG
ncbi:hypothetical protein RHS02_07834, partial [Rhizoctonia solani]